MHLRGDLGGPLPERAIEISAGAQCEPLRARRSQQERCACQCLLLGQVRPLMKLMLTRMLLLLATDYLRCRRRGTALRNVRQRRHELGGHLLRLLLQR